MKINKIYRLFFLFFALLLTMPSYAGDGFTSLLTEDNGQDFLPVEKAFQVKSALLDATHAEVQFLIVPGHYLYRERIQIVTSPDASAKVISVKLPEGEEKNDPTFGKQFVFHHDTLATVTFAGGTPTSLQVKYQGCSEKGLCYPPQTKQISLQATSTTSSLTPIIQSGTVAIESDSEDVSGALLHTGQWWKIVAGFFVAGLLLSFTPCVFPMIPILSGIIVGKQAHTSRAKAFSLSLAYTLGMCLTYTLAGVAAGLSGQLLSQALQTPVALITGALIFVLLALSMFGFYELKLPTVLESYFFNWSNRFKGGHLFSDFLMGAISALIISPCVAAPLAGALLYISQTHDVVLGGIALFSLSIGMGVPLLLIGASAGSILPKAGAWMNAVRRLFGVLMLAVAVWIVTPILPTNIQLLLWSALCVIPAIYMRAIDPLPMDATVSQRLIKGCAMMLLGYGLMLMVGAWSGASSPLMPLQRFVAETQPVTPLVFQKVKNTEELDAILNSNRRKQVMLDFYADWCVSCKEYEQFVFTNPQVKAALSQKILLQIDVTHNTEADAALLKRFGLFGPPGIIFFDVEGHQRTIIKGYQDSDQFLHTLFRLKETSHA